MILVVAVLVNVAFITLLERKILGYSQIRKGPNKVGFVGIFQPFNDAVKLFSKERVKPFNANKLVYFLTPRVALMLALVIFMVFPFHEISFSFSLSILIVYMVLRINIYPTLVSGWRSNRKFAMVGALRAVAQSVSYEVRLALLFLFFLSLRKTFSLEGLFSENKVWVKEIIFFPLVGIWLISCLAETNRTPFDFAEGESELVSGFNVEFGAVEFALIFMAEYARIMFMSFFFSFFFLTDRNFMLYFYSSLLIFFWVWVRATFPRYRFDLLMNMAWKVFLPIVLLLLAYSCILLI